MCGISGILSFGDLEIVPPIARTCYAMKKRGPDDEGYFLSSFESGSAHEIFGGEDTPKSVLDSTEHSYLPKKLLNQALGKSFDVALGHRRLSILDLSSRGHQPICDPSSRYWMVFNGEIYNFKDIAIQLEKEGVFVSGLSDTEVIIAAYTTWGEECLNHFNGDFALAIWDDIGKELFCARDRIGIRPFYYLLDENVFLFASDIKSIICSELYLPKPDRDGLLSTMAFGISSRPQTAFDSIFTLEPGYWMKVNKHGQAEKHRYWDVPRNCQDNKLSESSAVALLEEKLVSATKLRLISDVPVGTFMSGGVDSTTISAIASIYHPGIKAFTLAYENAPPSYDETPQAAATAQMYDMEHVVHRVDRDATLDRIDDWIIGYEEPYYSLSPNQIITELVAQDGIKVVLNGVGADELFGGYRYYRVAHFWKFLTGLSFLNSVIPKHVEGKLKLLNRVFKCKNPAELYVEFYQHMPDDIIKSLFGDDFNNDVPTSKRVSKLYWGEEPYSDAIEAMCYMDLKMYVGIHHVSDLDHFTMAHSIEGRFPFLDHELVEAAFRIPSRYKIKWPEQKYILRKLAASYIHESCLSMEKKGFGSPLAQWLDGPLAELSNGSLKRLKARGIVEPNAIDNLQAQYKLGKIPATYIWQMVSLELWYQYFIDNNGQYIKATLLHGIDSVYLH